ncbi:MAG: transporter [Rhodospirillaceae bacterium]|nr:transporter [Rhodospirillaceae bacterium]
MIDTFLALAPVFLLIAIGWTMKALLLPGDAMWRPIEKLAYYLAIPALVIHDLYRAELGTLPFGRMAVALVGAILIVAGLLVFLRPLLSRVLLHHDASFTSVFQGSVRANFFIILGAAPALLPADGAALVIIAVAFFTVTVNFLSVLVLARWGTQGEANLIALVKRLLTNPFIVATALGIAINLANPPIPQTVNSTLAMLAGAGVPLALLTAGSGLGLASIGTHLPGILISSLVRLVVTPSVALGLGLLLGLEASVLAMLVLFHSQPTSTSSYVLARQMGGDHELMAAILTTHTVLAILTIPVMLALFT